MILYGLSTYYPWIIHGLSMDYLWIIHGLPMDNPWIIHGSYMDYPWILSMDNPWVVHGQTDIGCVAKWHTMELARFLTRRISIVVRRASFLFFKQWNTFKSTKNLQNKSNIIENMTNIITK
jgi:hypothetical protein